jgi:hypothetical protein
MVALIGRCALLQVVTIVITAAMAAGCVTSATIESRASIDGNAGNGSLDG